MGAYPTKRHVVSFVGFAPVNNPAITVLVVMDAPVGSQDGGAVAAPIFTRVAQQVLGYLGVAHDVAFRDPQRLMLRAKAKDADLAEGSTDRIASDAHPATPPPL